MDFCPDCGTRLIAKRDKEGTKINLQIVCPKCGYKKTGKNNAAVTPKSIKRPRKEAITVIGKEHQLRTLPTDKIACTKCGNNLAYVWQVQTRSGDEGATHFFRCTKCNHTFREYTWAICKIFQILRIRGSVLGGKNWQPRRATINPQMPWLQARPQNLLQEKSGFFPRQTGCTQWLSASNRKGNHKNTCSLQMRQQSGSREPITRSNQIWLETHQIAKSKNFRTIKNYLTHTLFSFFSLVCIYTCRELGNSGDRCHGNLRAFSGTVRLLASQVLLSLSWFPPFLQVYMRAQFPCMALIRANASYI